MLFVGKRWLVPRCGVPTQVEESENSWHDRNQHGTKGLRASSGGQQVSGQQQARQQGRESEQLAPREDIRAALVHGVAVRLFGLRHLEDDARSVRIHLAVAGNGQWIGNRPAEVLGDRDRSLLGLRRLNRTISRGGW